MNETSANRSLVVGATGMGGSHGLRHFILRGDRPLALSRISRQSVDADWIRGDLEKPDTLAKADATTLYSTANPALMAQALPYLARPRLRRLVAFTSTSILTKENSE